MKKGIDIIEFIQRNHLEDAVVTMSTNSNTLYNFVELIKLLNYDTIRPIQTN